MFSPSNTWPQQQKKLWGIHIPLKLISMSSKEQREYNISSKCCNYIKIVLASAIESNIKNPCIHFHLALHHRSTLQRMPVRSRFSNLVGFSKNTIQL
jgi:hypothetical protein